MPADPARTLEYNHPDLERAYAAAPEGTRVELLRGVVCMAPSPRPRHQLAAGELYALLRGPFRGPRRAGPEGPGGWFFMPEPELALGERPDRMQPDLAGWRVEQVRFGPDTLPIKLAPEWVCEVLSPSTEGIDRGVKAPLYAEHGVAHLWLVDPEHRVLELYEPSGGAMRQVARFEGDRVVRATPFDAVDLDLGALWRWPGA